jgi:hypothetical protein
MKELDEDWATLVIGVADGVVPLPWVAEVVACFGLPRFGLRPGLKGSRIRSMAAARLSASAAAAEIRRKPLPKAGNSTEIRPSERVLFFGLNEHPSSCAGLQI